MTSPLVSVILPHYRQQWALPLALRSIADQTFRDFELIVVDDGSPLSDPPMPPLPPTGCLLVRHPENRGTAAAINTGFGLARGKYATWVSADNLMAGTWLETLLHVLEDEAGAAYGGFYWCAVTRAGIEAGEVTTPTRSRYLFVPHESARQIGQEACYYGPAFLIRRSIWQAAGDHEGRISHDLGHWLRVEEACWDAGLRVVGVDRPLCWYMAHEARATVTRAAEYDAPAILAAAKVRRLAKYSGMLSPA